MNHDPNDDPQINHNNIITEIRSIDSIGNISDPK